MDLHRSLLADELVGLPRPFRGVGGARTLLLPFEFVEETWDNKLSDLVVNTVGFALGMGLRYDPQTLD